MPHELVLSGTPTFNGDSSCTIDATGSDRVRSSAVYIDKTQAWVAVRAQMNWSNDTALPNVQPFFFDWADAETPTVIVSRLWVEVDVIIARRGGQQLNVSHTFATNDHITVIYAWNASEHKVSVNGAAFSTQSSSVQATVHSLYDIGGHSGGSGLRIEADVHWFMAGTGTLTDGNAATIHGWGNTDPILSLVPGSPTMLWPAESAAFLLAPPYINVTVAM